MAASEIAALAARQWREYRARTPGLRFAEPGFTLGLPEAYAVQQAVAALRLAEGDRLAGYKLGCTGPGTVRQFGMAGPIRACLFQSELRRHGATVPAADFACLAVEAEMALRIGADGGIAAAFPVIELHHFVFRGPRKTLAELVANNGLNGGVVLPEEQRAAEGQTLSLRLNGVEIEAGGLWPLPGGPQASLAWLRAHLAESGLALLPGQLVLAGTPLGLYPVSAGDLVEVCVDGTPGIRCQVA